MTYPLSRQSALLLTTGFLLVAFLLYKFVFSDSGITVREQKMPLSKVLSQIKKKGGVAIHTNIDPGTLVSIDVERVPLSEAMEVLATTLDARWGPYHALAPDKAGISQVLGLLEADTGMDGASTFYRPMGGPMDWVAGDYLPDFKKMTWVRESVTGKKDMTEVLSAMAEGSDAGYVIPAEWNPVLSRVPTHENLQKAVGQLADATNAQRYSFIYLYRRPRVPEADGERPRFAGGDREPANESVLNQRMGIRLASLPAEEREEAQKNWDEQQNLMKEMRALPPEQRRERFQQLMEDPVWQEKMELAMEKRDSRRSPEARRDRYKRYADRRMAARGGQ